MIGKNGEFERLLRNYRRRLAAEIRTDAAAAMAAEKAFLRLEEQLEVLEPAPLVQAVAKALLGTVRSWVGLPPSFSLLPSLFDAVDGGEAVKETRKSQAIHLLDLARDKAGNVWRRRLVRLLSNRAAQLREPESLNTRELGSSVDSVHARPRYYVATGGPYLETLQFAGTGPTRLVHAVHETKTLCGVDLFASETAGWTRGGGVSGPDIEIVPCPVCVEAAKRRFPGWVIVGGETWSVPLAAAIGVMAGITPPSQRACPNCNGPTTHVYDEPQAAEHCERCGWHEADELRRAAVEGEETNR